MTKKDATKDTTKKDVSGEDAARQRQSASAQECPETSTQERSGASTHQQKALPVLKSPGVLGKYFRHLFRTESWGESDPPPPYRSGPVPKAAGSLGQQRLADPEARFHYSVMMSEVMLLPICVAHDAAEKEKLNAEIAEIMGLDVAVEKGWIDSFMVCWRAGSFPTSPTGIRVRTAPGRRTREQVLGSLEPHIRRFIKYSQTGPYDPIHVMNARRVG